MKTAHIAYVFLSLSLCGCGGRGRNTAEISGLEKMGKVNVLYVSIAETMKLQSKSGRTWQNWLVRGGAFYQIDLKKVNREYLEKGEISMPEPVVYPVANMEKTKPIAAGTDPGITDKAFNKMTTQVSTEATKIVEKAALNEEYMKIAKGQAEEVMKKMLGRDEITISWNRGE